MIPGRDHFPLFLKPVVESTRWEKSKGTKIRQDVDIATS